MKDSLKENKKTPNKIDNDINLEKNIYTFHINKNSKIIIKNFIYNNLFELISTISNQVNYIIIVDNNSSDQLIFKKLEFEKTYIIFNNQNFGIAKALNQGIKKAITLDCDWVITFDQDSKPKTNIFPFSSINGLLMIEVFSIINAMAAFCVVILSCISFGNCLQVVPFLLMSASHPIALLQVVS